MKAKFDIADVIKVSAVLTAAPRWVMALLRSEGLSIPDQFASAWLWTNVLLALGMAVTEALAINYIFNSWRNQRDKRAQWLLLLVAGMLASFLFAMTPSVMASAYRVPLEEVLGRGWLWISWSAAVGLSTILAVAGVGYASKDVKFVNLDSQKESVNKMSRESIRGLLLSLYTEDPHMPVMKAAHEVGVSRPTVYKYLGEFQEEGLIARNGNS